MNFTQWPETFLTNNPKNLNYEEGVTLLQRQDMRAPAKPGVSAVALWATEA